MAQEPFLWGRAGAKLTPDQVAKERENAALLAKAAMDYSPVGHWSQGLNRVAQGILAGIDYRRADKAESEIADVNKGLISSLLSGSGSAPASSSAIPMTAGAGEVAATAPAVGGPEGYRNAIASIESQGSGDYAAIGPTNKTLGRPLGRYQIMEANLGPWSREALGREVTPDEFLANPQIQDAIFDKKFGSYVQQYGPEGAAQAWFAGPGGVGKVDRADVLGTSVGEYGQRFTSALGPTEVASATPEAAIEAISPTQGGSLTDEVAAFEQTPAYSAQFPGQAAGVQGEVPPLSAPVEIPALPVAGPQDAVAQAITQQPVEVAGEGDRQGINPAIIEALTNPQASPQTQRVAAILLEQEQRRMQAAEEQRLQAADPLRQLQLDEQRLKVDAMRRPEEAKAPTLVDIYDPQTGQPYKAQWNPKTQAFDRVGGIKAPSGTSLTVSPDGQVSFTQGGAKPLTENQSKLTLFQSLQTETQPVLLDLENQFNPANIADAAARSTPIAGNFFQSEQGQIYSAASTAWAEGALRIATGAAATPEEMERTKRAYFAQPGDTPNAIAFKAQMREMYNRSINRSLGKKDVTGSLPKPSDFAKKFDDEDEAPEGVDASDWEFMTPEERRLFKQ